MKVSKNALQYFYPWGKDADYHIIGKEEVTRTVSHKIPLTTGFYEQHFPKYLKGFEGCYNRHTDVYGRRAINRWTIKPEYIDDRPHYSISVTYTEYEVEFTEKGKKEIERRYNIHKRNLEKYARLMG